MTNKINKCDGNHGGPRCADPECWNDAPAPPAGGDVEVLGYWCVPKEAPLQGRYIEARHADLEAGGFSESFAAVFNVTELVDRAHVTQLKAEVTEQALCAASEARRALRAESELAKARELIGDLRADTQSGYLKAVQALHNWANQPAPRGYSNIVMTGTSCNQSAPADKVHGEPVAWANWKVGTKSYVPYRTEEAASRSVAYSELAATQLGPYQVVPLYAAQPAPVAVDDCDLKALMDRHEAWKAGEANGIASMVMPDRVTAQSHWPEWKISGSEGWNACLDELARLNPIKQ